jgi:hypothetical protein
MIEVMAALEPDEAETLIYRATHTLLTAPFEG